MPAPRRLAIPWNWQTSNSSDRYKKSWEHSVKMESDEFGEVADEPCTQCKADNMVCRRYKPGVCPRVRTCSACKVKRKPHCSFSARSVPSRPWSPPRSPDPDLEEGEGDPINATATQKGDGAGSNKRHNRTADIGRFMPLSKRQQTSPSAHSSSGTTERDKVTRLSPLVNEMVQKSSTQDSASPPTHPFSKVWSPLHRSEVDFLPASSVATRPGHGSPLLGCNAVNKAGVSPSACTYNGKGGSAAGGSLKCYRASKHMLSASNTAAPLIEAFDRASAMSSRATKFSPSDPTEVRSYRGSLEAKQLGSETSYPTTSVSAQEELIERCVEGMTRLQQRMVELGADMRSPDVDLKLLRQRHREHIAELAHLTGMLVRATSE